MSSKNSLAQVNHKRKHVREGMLVELEYTGRGGYRPNSFIRPDHADRACSRPGTTGGFRDDGGPWIDQVWVPYLGADLDEVSYPHTYPNSEKTI
jgi:hypothetical protein